MAYAASGFGPYPFWAAGTPGSGSLTAPGTAIATAWSAVRNAERLEHAACSLASLGEGAADGPCVHLFLGANAWLCVAVLNKNKNKNSNSPQPALSSFLARLE